MTEQIDNIFQKNAPDVHMPRAIIAAVDTGDCDVERSVAELKELIRTAGGETVAEVVQKRQAPDS